MLNWHHQGSKHSMTLYLDGVLMLFVNSCNESHHLQGMANTRSMTRKQNQKRVKNCDNGGVAPWADLGHDVLFLVMMQLGVIDFLAFSGVCKSWRSFALNNKKIFMESRPPMLMSISERANKKSCYCCLEDFEGRKFKTILPRSAGRICVGITCGYLILFGWEAKDFWLVNLITSHQLHFPCFPYYARPSLGIIRGILVFSPSISRWVFVVFCRYAFQIWFSIAGTRAWNHVPTFPTTDIHAFKGKIYVVNTDCRLFEMRLTPEPKLILLQTNIFPKPLAFLGPEFVSSSENLYVMYCGLRYTYKVYKLDFEEMKWVSSHKTLEECAFLIYGFKYSAAIKLDLWSLYDRFTNLLITYGTSRKGGYLPSHIWYCPNDCLNVNLLDE